MPLTTGYSFGDVVLVPFPFTDQTGLPVLTTIERHLVLKKLGRFQQVDVRALRTSLDQILG